MYGWYGYSHSDRTFHYAIAASLVLHALLLFVVPGLKEGRNVPETPGVLVARIVEPARVPIAAPPQPEPVARPPVEPPKPRVEPLPKPPPVRTPSPVVEPAPAPQPPPQAAPAAPPPAAPPAAASAPPSAAPAEAREGAATEASLGSLRDFERQLSFAAQRYRSYPRVALDNAWEGTVELEIVIGSNGLIRSMNVKTSSGRDILDKEAMDMFRKAKRIVPIPPSLVGKEFTTVRTVVFELKQGG